MKSFNEFREFQFEEAELTEIFDGSKVRIHAPGYPLHGKEADVFHRFDDGRVNVQVRHSNRKGDVTNLTLGKDQYKEVAKEGVEIEEGVVPAERNRPELSSGDKDKLGKLASLMSKEKAKKDEDLPFTPDKPHKPVATAGKFGSGYSTARHLARQGMKDVQKEEVELE